MDILIKQARTYLWLINNINKKEFPFLYNHYIVQLIKVKDLIDKQNEETKTIELKLVA